MPSRISDSFSPFRMKSSRRQSGLRIRDAVTLERHRPHGDSLLLYQAKTGRPVYVPLPPHVVELLEDVPPGPKSNPRYFFRGNNGDTKRRSARNGEACRFPYV